MVQETEMGGPAREFPATRWTMILSTQDRTEASANAIRELLSDYWKPLYMFARRKGLQPEGAKDAVQGFFLQLLERDFLSSLDPERGQLRSYLRTSLSHYLINLHEKGSAARRGGGVRPLSLDVDVAEKCLPATPESPDAAYDREWAWGIMEGCLATLKSEFEKGDRGGPFELVETFFRFGQPPAYAEAAGKHGMSIPAIKSFLHRARGRFRELVRAEVAGTVSDPREIDSEMAELMRLLAS